MLLHKRHEKEGLRKMVLEEEYDKAASLAQGNNSVAIDLVKLLEDPDEQIRENAAEVVSRIGKDTPLAPETIKVVMPYLTSLLQSPNEEIREVAVVAVTGIAWRWYDWEDFPDVIIPVIPRLIALLDDSSTNVRGNTLNCIQVLAEWMEDKKGDFDQLKPALPKLLAHLKDNQLCLYAVGAVRAIAHRNPELVRSMLGEITRLSAHPKDSVRLNTARTLSYLAEAYPEELTSTISSLCMLLQDPWERVSENAALALGFLGEVPEPETVVSRLIKLLEDNRGEWRSAAARALVRMAETDRAIRHSAMCAIRKLLHVPNEQIRVEVARLLSSLTNESK